MAGGDLLPFVSIVLVQLGYAGMNFTSMFAMHSGMHPLVLVAYRLLFATVAIAPFAYFMERATGNMVLYFIGLKNSSPTIGCALTNTLPAFAFILAVLFRQESLGIKTRPGQAKVIGTIICVGGALILSFYHGNIINIGESSIHWTYAENMEKNSSTSSGHGNVILGPFLLILSSLSWSIWFIIQARMSKTFSAPYTSTTLMCFMGFIECGIIAAISKPVISAWSLSNPMWLLAALYTLKGPLYVSVFTPLLLVIVAITSWALLREKLYVGTALGSLLIVMGLYAVLWGKNKETKPANAIKKIEATKIDDDMIAKDLEMQFDAKSNGNHNSAEKPEDM
ncbi:wat1-related protein [Quercus suber]|uniref:WAT1-related protein n=1 Tax=Quercus suber TaxID=58331 RepID=A0AAW0IHM5_QUESU